MAFALGTAVAFHLAFAAPPGPATATSFYANFKGATLLDQNGRPVVPQRLAGRTVLVNFVYTGCSTACPLQTRALAELQGRLPRELQARVQFLSVSIDPLNDTPKALKSFAQRMGADLSAWTFATGKPADVDRLADTLRLFRTGTDARQPEDHSTALWLVDAQGELRMRYSGATPDVPRLQREITELDRLTRNAGG